jgi:hypothetical protein
MFLKETKHRWSDKEMSNQDKAIILKRLVRFVLVEQKMLQLQIKNGLHCPIFLPGVRLFEKDDIHHRLRRQLLWIMQMKGHGMEVKQYRYYANNIIFECKNRAHATHNTGRGLIFAGVGTRP